MKQSNYPGWIQKYLSEAQATKISHAVASAEQKTKGEIVVVVAKKSSTTGHVGLNLFFILLSLLLLTSEYFIQAWLWQERLLIEGGMVLFLAVVSYFLQKLFFIQRAFVPGKDELISVQRRAELEFTRQNIKQTAGRTGILIFVSVMERKAIVLADQAVAAVCPEETWKQILHDLLAGVRSGDWEKGFTEAIHASGKVLAEKFPSNTGGANELSNQLRIVE